MDFFNNVTLYYMITPAANAMSVSIMTNEIQSTGNTTYLLEKTSRCVRLPNISFFPRVNTDTTLVTHTTEKSMYQVLQLVVSVIICIAGIPTNFINLIAFFKLGLKDRVNACLFWLSFCDMMSLTSHILRSGELAVQFYAGENLRLFRSDMVLLLYDYGLGTISGFRQISFFMYAFIALDRCLCVLMPLHARRILTNKFTTIIIVTGSILCFTVNIFSELRQSSLCIIFMDTGTRGYLIGLSQRVKSNPLLMQLSLILDSFLLGLALPVLFLTTVVVSTIITAVVLRRRGDWLRQVTFSSTKDAVLHSHTYGKRRSGGGHSSDGGSCTSSLSVRSTGSAGSQEVAITQMLVIVSSIYIFCTVPVFLHHLTRYLLPGFYMGGRYGNLMMVTYYVNSVLVNFNGSINFIVFYRQGSRFRKQVYLMFCGCSTQAVTRANGENTVQSEIAGNATTTMAGTTFPTS